MSEHGGGANRVWIQQAAIDAATKPKPSSFGRRPSGQGSVTSSVPSVAPLLSDSDSGDNSSNISHGRTLVWGWKAGWLVDSSSDAVQVRVSSDASSNDPMTSRLSPRQQTTVFHLPPTALQDGLVVLANDFEVSEHGTPLPPQDLITLTHLHEPAVVESLQHRFLHDSIYTNTGPVLLALNPFQNVRGLYGESVMKKFWEHAERRGNNQASLEPHVYAIADASFRSMMRGIEDSLGTTSVEETTKTRTNCNQSILVSGESGAGKTVTTKFVMKYLAALSQRSAVLHEPEKRAYLQVAERKQQEQELSKTKTSSTSSQPSWALNAKSSSSPWNSRSNSTSSTGSKQDSGLQSVTVLQGTSSNSIESKVLQSNPILESFGNARTVRNDNSSRFGKFIEIQFTNTGKLVGAQIETYLLEKVRLATQSVGERNYHVFSELLSGAMETRELSHYYLAPTATPADFKMTASGTYDRRDGVTDKETYRQLRTAMNTMKFSPVEQKQIFSITAAILHASNLTFLELPHDKSALDKKNVHLLPVCNLLGVTEEDLESSLCSFSITAGKSQTVQRSLTKAKAEKGLEALLKATYGALFEFIVKRINDSIAYKEEAEDEEDGYDSHGRPVASIGVLDIFGFESFTKNSFEQLCINYCNEALQQQFNAFVLRNEQAEYEREGIEWSFIEFPENQDVLDLIEKRGSGILSILDDQCRAPGPSDKAFCLALYSTCSGQPRFDCSRKQTASLQFSVMHYAGPVEYTSDGFVEKNRDEYPKEMTELLKNSEIGFVQDLAKVLAESQDDSSDQATGSTPRKPTPKKLHRMDSSVGRATLGGQFRKQLRNLRTKIDATSPHYVRCLKPNDHLVPDHFDTAVVAEQLRCGGILEAVRVARAGFTQHYPHLDFVRRYRALAWRELAKKDAIRQPPSPVKPSYSGSRSFGHHQYVQNIRSAPEPQPKPEITPADAKQQCKELLKVLYRKLVQLEKLDEANIRGSTSQDVPPVPLTPPAASAKAKTFTSSTPPPTWSKSARKTASPHGTPPVSGGVKSRYSPFEQKPSQPTPPSPTPTSTWRRGVTSTDFAKVGIQMGKSKIFLRHKAFESLERIRSREQSQAASKLNSIFRMYLCRLAYVPYRDAFRRELSDRRRMYEDEEFKETKEPEYEDERNRSARFHSTLKFYRGGAIGGSVSLVDKWAHSQIRDAIHNPVPRHEWGKQPVSGNFKWVIVEGIWTKNFHEKT